MMKYLLLIVLLSACNLDKFCDPACSDQHVCIENGCFPAFDRTYKITLDELRLPELSPGEAPRRIAICVDDDCAGYYWNLPIYRVLTSHSVIDTRGDFVCVMPVTIEHLQAGFVHCGGGDEYLRLGLEPR